MAEVEPRPKIRPIRASDAGALADVQLRSWRQAYDGILEADYLASLDSARLALIWQAKLVACGLSGGPVREAVFVAETAGGEPELLGFVELGGSRAPVFPAAGEVYMLYLEPGAQRRGLGRRLMDVAARELRGRGYPLLLAQVLEKNLSARSFYTKWGMQQVGTTSTTWIGGRAYSLVSYLRRL
jgi:ribosomal protein S18 acetylase RimI-like enzyme